MSDFSVQAPKVNPTPVDQTSTAVDLSAVRAGIGAIGDSITAINKAKALQAKGSAENDAQQWVESTRQSVLSGNADDLQASALRAHGIDPAHIPDTPDARAAVQAATDLKDRAKRLLDAGHPQSAVQMIVSRGLTEINQRHPGYEDAISTIAGRQVSAFNTDDLAETKRQDIADQRARDKAVTDQQFQALSAMGQTPEDRTSAGIAAAYMAGPGKYAVQAYANDQQSKAILSKTGLTDAQRMSQAQDFLAKNGDAARVGFIAQMQTIIQQKLPKDQHEQAMFALRGHLDDYLASHGVTDPKLKTDFAGDLYNSLDKFSSYDSTDNQRVQAGNELQYNLTVAQKGYWDKLNAGDKAVLGATSLLNKEVGQFIQAAPSKFIAGPTLAAIATKAFGGNEDPLATTKTEDLGKAATQSASDFMALASTADPAKLSQGVKDTYAGAVSAFLKSPRTQESQSVFEGMLPVLADQKSWAIIRESGKSEEVFTAARSGLNSYAEAIENKVNKSVLAEGLQTKYSIGTDGAIRIDLVNDPRAGTGGPYIKGEATGAYRNPEVMATLKAAETKLNQSARAAANLTGATDWKPFAANIVKQYEKFYGNR